MKQEAGRSGQRERAFSLLEVLVSISLLGIVLASVFPVANSLTRYVRSMSLRSEAVALAQQKFDELRARSIDALPASGSAAPEALSMGAHNFQLLTTYCAGAAAWCPSNRTRHIRIQVFHQNQEIHRAETIFTRLR